MRQERILTCTRTRKCGWSGPEHSLMPTRNEERSRSWGTPVSDYTCPGCGGTVFTERKAPAVQLATLPWLSSFASGHYATCPHWATQLVKARREETRESLADAVRYVARMLSDAWF